MTHWKQILAVLGSFSLFFGVAAGTYTAIHSPLFYVRVVEVAESPKQAADQTPAIQAPVDAQEISRLAAIPLGQVGLFDLNLREIEARIQSNPWVDRVHLQKQPPQTLSIMVDFKEPQAIFQNEDGALSYVDEKGQVFGTSTLAHHSDLPLLVGFAPTDESSLRDAVKFLMVWEGSAIARSVSLSSLVKDQERGFRALMTYPMLRDSAQPSLVRTMVDLGTDLTERASKMRFERLGSVFQYLSNNGIFVRRIWADAGKKVVVRIAPGS